LACRTCDLLFIHPYASDVDEKVTTFAYDDLPIVDPARHHASAELYLNTFFSDIRTECCGAQSLLDVGCGTGTLLEMLRTSRPDMRCVGVELNIARAEFAKELLDCEIYQIPIEQFACDETFDIITLIDVLSHIPSFDDLFASIRRLMADNGKLILKVGEVAAHVKKDAIHDWGIPDHLHCLGMNTIDFICNKYRFEVARHDRRPFSADLFSRARWLGLGRSTVINIVKRAVLMTPFALAIMRDLYDRRHGGTVFSSFIVLTPQLN
jgi:SAM-dependent methyltransferase